VPSFQKAATEFLTNLSTSILELELGIVSPPTPQARY
jgi:hypothetical protein